MKRLSEVKDFYQIFDNLRKEEIKTDKDFKEHLKLLGIKFIEVESDIGFNYGFYNKNTGTSLYIISEYEPTDIFLEEDTLKDLRRWMKEGYPESGLEDKKWKKACK